jgi:alpha-L-fucosidase
MKNFSLTLALLILVFTGIAQESKNSETRMEKMWGETSVSVDALKAGREKLFDEGNFGMIVHWGLYSQLGSKWKGKTYYGIAEWIMNKNYMAGIPVGEYKKIAKEFNPTSFDAKAIARLAKDAGMKYIIITSKHHDGFAMFKSKVDSFNIVDATPFARDPMTELSAACHELGLGFGFYYSHNQDWTEPGGSSGPKEYTDGKPASFEDYFYKKCLPQVKEICTNYGQIDFVWFDTPGAMKKENVIELAKVVRELQPNAMLCSRIGYGLGDYAANGDNEVPKRNVEGLWETIDSNNDSWGFSWFDNNFKSSKEILRQLISTVGRGGTYLFNVGPDALGTVPETGVHFLEETGKWIQKYPQVIYGAGCSPWGHALPWGDVTTKGNSMFLSVFDWPGDGKLYLPGLKSKIVSAKLLEGTRSTKISFDQKEDWTIFKVPFKPADLPVSVIEIVLEGQAVKAKVNADYGIFPNIEIELLAEFAEASEAKKAKESWMEKFGEWKHVTQISKWGANSNAEWFVNVFEPGYYSLDLCFKGEGKLVWKTITDEGEMVQNQQLATAKYQFGRMGIIHFKTAGKHTITVSLVEGNGETSSLESVKISPVE